MNIYHIFKLILTLITSLIRRQFMNIKKIKIWKIMKVKRTKTPVTSIINYILKMLISQKTLQFRSPYKLVACLKFPFRKNSDECRQFKLFSDKATDLQFIPTNMHMKQYNTVKNKGYEQYLIIFSD